MKVMDVIFGKCPARAKIFYTKDGEKRWAYAYGLGVCYTCVEYHLKRISWKGGNK